MITQANFPVVMATQISAMNGPRLEWGLALNENRDARGDFSTRLLFPPVRENICVEFLRFSVARPAPNFYANGTLAGLFTIA